MMIITIIYSHNISDSESLISDLFILCFNYRWKDITNVINHKRHFGMECQNPEDSTQYQLADVESAKYVWRMCVHQVK